jgi:hypothetical protein
MKRTVKAHLHLSISLTYSLVFCCSAYSQFKTDSSYFPLAIGNQSQYTSIPIGTVVTETVVDTQRVNGKLYYGLAINSTSPLFWLRKDSGRVYIAPDITIQSESTAIKEDTLYDFSADVNEKWSLNLQFGYPGMSCDYNGVITLTNKDDAVVTLLGIYRNCFVFAHYHPCDDAGRVCEWFARGVGRVFYYQDNMWGLEGFVLTKSNLVTSRSSHSQSHAIIEYHLLQNYPNPFNPTTTITFQLPERSFVVLGIFDRLGRKIETLVNSYLNSGYHSFIWDASEQTTGVYFCKVHTKDFSQTIKLVLIR